MADPLRHEPIEIMPKTKRLILDIGLYPETESSQNLATQTASRFMALLRYEYQYKLSHSDHIRIGLSAESASYFTIKENSKLDSSRIILVEAQNLVKTNEPDLYCYWVVLIADILKHIAAIEHSEIESINAACETLLKMKNDTLIKIEHLSSRFKNYSVEGYLMVSGYFDAAQLYAKITDLSNGKIVQRLIAQASIHEIRLIAGRFSIVGDELILHPQKTGSLNFFRSRGFTSPIRIKLAEIFSSAFQK